jgi:class 3 adenylate cyclase
MRTGARSGLGKVIARAALVCVALLAALAVDRGTRHDPPPRAASPFAAARFADVLFDPSGTLPFATVRALPDRAWAPLAKARPPHASWLHPSTMWLRFALRPHAEDGQTLLQTGPAVLSIDVTDASGRVRRGGYAGGRLPFADRAPPLVRPTVSLPPDAATGATLYARIESESDLPALRLTTLEDADIDQRDDLTTRAFFVGLIFAFGLANLLTGLRLRDRSLLLYAGLAFSGAAWFSTQGLLTSVYLWPNHWISFQGGHRIAVDAYAIFLVLFTRRFLDLPKVARAWDRALIAMLVFYLASGWIGDLFPALRIATLSGEEVALLVLVLLVFVTGLTRYRAGSPGAGYIAVASGGQVVGWTLSVLSEFDIIPLVGRPIMTATAWESLVLALALADRILRANRERDREKDARLRAQADALEAEREANRTLQAYNEAFARFVPREFLEYLERESILHVRLGDQVERSMVVLFSDIRSFTSISETLGAQATFNYLNDYLQVAGPLVREHGGFIDKYIGDAIMALFPRGADDALAAAIALQRAVDVFNERAHPSGAPPVAVGVGLHAGTLMLGTIGEERRLETTVIADAVNVASRVEGLTKVYGARILLTGALRDALARPDAFGLRLLGSVAAKGKREGVPLYECFDADEPALANGKRSSLGAFADAAGAYARGDFAAAAAAFGALAQRYPDDAAVAHYRDRARLLESAGVTNWDGVDRMEVK